MPAPLAVDRDAVKAHAITHGLRPAAQAFNLPVATLAAWSARDKDGPWCPRKVQTVVVRPATLQPRANTANTASVAAKNSMDSLYERTRLNMAKAADKGFKTAAQQSGDVVIARAEKLKSLAGVAAVAHPQLRETTGGTINAVVNIGFLGPQTAFPALDGPVVMEDSGQA